MPDRLAEIAARAEAATPGPWTYRSLPHDDWGLVRAADGLPVANTAMAVRNDDDPAPWDSEKGEFPESAQVAANGLFVTHAREDVPYLLARVAELETALQHIWDRSDMGCQDEENGEDSRNAHAVMRAICRTARAALER